MIVQSFRSVLWVGAVASAAIGCYMVSLRVAAERASLERVETRILLAKRDIRALDTELVTRGRVRQLERWNVDVLALSAPTEGQFLEGEVELASLTAPLASVPATTMMAAAKDAPIVAVPSPGAPVADEVSDAEVRPMVATYAVPEEKARNPLLVRASAPASTALRERGTAMRERGTALRERETDAARSASATKTVKAAAAPKVSKASKPHEAKAAASKSPSAKKVKASTAL